MNTQTDTEVLGAHLMEAKNTDITSLRFFSLFLVTLLIRRNVRSKVLCTNLFISSSVTHHSQHSLYLCIPPRKGHQDPYGARTSASDSRETEVFVMLYFSKAQHCEMASTNLRMCLRDTKASERLSSRYSLDEEEKRSARIPTSSSTQGQRTANP